MTESQHNHAKTAIRPAYRITWHFQSATHVGYWCGSCYATRTMPGPSSLAELHEGPFTPPEGALCAGCQKSWANEV